MKFEADQEIGHPAANRMLAVGFIAAGMLYLGLAFVLPTFPVPITCAALAVYILMTVIMWLVDPINAARMIFRIIIMVAW